MAKNDSKESRQKAESLVVLRKRLLDLYKEGVEVEFAADEGDFSLWVEKVVPWQDRDAIQRSKSVRAPIIALKRDKTNPERDTYLEAFEDIGLKTKDDKIAFLIAPELRKAELSNEARIAAEDKWAKEDYLISLQEAWTDGLKDRWLKDNEDAEAARVFAELKKFQDEVNEANEHDRQELIEDLKSSKSDEWIENEVIDILIDNEANTVQIIEYRKWLLYYAVRDPEDHDVLFFESRDDIDKLDPKVTQRLFAAYDDLTLDDVEGKD